jgi:hypothetical protein
MNKVKLVKQFRSRAKFAGGMRPQAYSYDLGKYYRADKVTDFIKYKIDKIPNNKKLFFATNARYYNLNNKTMFSQFTNKNKVNVFPSFLEDSKESVEDSMIRYVTLYVLPHDPNDPKIRKKYKVGKDDTHNDCLHRAIAFAFDNQFHFLPAKINKPSKFKKFLGYERDDKIELSEELLEKLEKLMKCSFIITGAFSYTSKQICKINISLTVKDNHIIKSTFNEGREAKLIAKKQENIFTVKFVDDEIVIYGGNDEKYITTQEYEILKANHDYLLIKCGPKENMQVKRIKYLDKADKLLKASNGLINYYKSQYPSVIGYELVKSMTRYINTFDELDDFEQIVINWAYRGGIHYFKDAEGDFFDIDMNSAYMNFLSSNNFNFSVKKPEVHEITTWDFNAFSKKFYPYGLYFVVFTSSHPFFSCVGLDKPEWVTHFDLTAAKLLGVKFNIVERQTNALLYPSKNCIKGNHSFGKLADFLYELKKKGEDVKDLLVCINGVFAQKLVKRHRLTGDDTADIDDEFIEELVETEKITTIKTTPRKGKIFKYSDARISPFLTAYVRLQMTRLLLKQPLETVMSVNTDGWVSSIPRDDLKYTVEMGDFKVHQGNCKVYSSQRVTWECKTCGNWGKKHCEKCE